MPSYRKAIAWIAENEGSKHVVDLRLIYQYVSVQLIAEIWGKERCYVAKDVAQFRFKFTSTSNPRTQGSFS